MKKLLEYLNNKSPEERDIFAKACGTSDGYLRKAVYKNQVIGAELCVAIEKVSRGEVTRFDLRPFDWHMVWPELEKKRSKK